jgi:integrase
MSSGRRLRSRFQHGDAGASDASSGGDITVHGFRSTFRDWVEETTNYAGTVAEAALAHVVGDKVEAAYRRGDLFEKRRRLMNAWATFCTTPVGRRRLSA